MARAASWPAGQAAATAARYAYSSAGKAPVVLPGAAAARNAARGRRPLRPPAPPGAGAVPRFRQPGSCDRLHLDEREDLLDGSLGAVEHWRLFAARRPL